MAFTTKRLLSESTSGRGILITATATAGTTIHTAVATADGIDEVWLWAYNGHTANLDLTLEMGGTTDPDDHIQYTVPFDDGAHLVCPGLAMAGGLSIAGFTGTTGSQVTVFGYVNRIWTATT